MSEFLTGNNLNDSLGGIISSARRELVIVSPHIKIHNIYLDLLANRKDDPNLKIIVIFRKGKRSDYDNIRDSDLKFLSEFRNVQISMNKNLHAKIYANDFSYLMTSMNMYEYSQKNNIEFGVLYNGGQYGPISRPQAILLSKFKYQINKLIKNSELVYSVRPDNPLLLFQELFASDSVDNIGNRMGNTWYGGSD